MPQWAGSCWYYIGYLLKEDGKRIAGFNRVSFIEAMEKSGIQTRIAEKIIDKFFMCTDKWFALIDDSFLSSELKSNYKILVKERMNRIAKQ